MPASRCCLFLSLACLVLINGVRANEDGPAVDFNSQIRPILTQYCSSCHGGVKQAGDLSFIYPEQVLPPDGWVVEPGDPDASVLIERVITDDPDLRMPPPDEHPDPVPAEKVVLLRRWIAQGAKWGGPWSMAPLLDAAAGLNNPTSAWVRQPLDHLVQSRLRSEGFTPATDAAPAQWLRRVSFDLIGLPPTHEQTTAFVAACAAASGRSQVERVYAREVDRLLNSEHFGERWASVWMDLARYADSKGFEKDPHRDMWPYRDWLIRAFNRDLPYDEFTIKQLAGDLLPSATADDLIATAFHRNTQTNTEGGTDDEEFRVAAVIDRVNTTWTVWQATTFGCVQCHSHPYDPLKQEEYYACMALFNNEQDADLDDDYPTLKIPSDPAQREAAVAAWLGYESLRQVRNDLGLQVAKQVEWKPLTPTTAETTGGRLKIEEDQVRSDGGTFPVGVKYTIDVAAVPMNALRIEILPLSDDPLKWPEQGSVLTHLAVSTVTAEGETAAVEIADVFADALTGPMDPQSCLTDNNQGVGEFPKLHGPRAAYMVLKERCDPATGAKLRIEMAHKANTTGNVATPIRKFRWSSTDDSRWKELLNSEELSKTQLEVNEAKAVADKINGAKLPIVFSRPTAAARSTRVFMRGNWQARDKEVAAAIPNAFQPTDVNSAIDVGNRLQFARWLVSKQNPLAARVWANRVWAELFELGLVETLEDFGSSGLLPSHPELLDHLAIRMRDTYSWHLKPFLRELVLSSTYRQNNATPEALRERDPRNRLLARGPRTRLSAEMIRDQALRVSGLLTDQVGGPSVMPPQPDGVWQTVYSGAKWKTAVGPQRYRRAIYTYWRRTSPYPSLLMFDSPTRDLCSARRIATNTPLQALVTLNDPVYTECAQAFAGRASDVAGESVNEAITWMVRAAIGSDPTDLEMNQLQKLYADLCEEDSDAEFDRPAMAIVANTILNMDKALTK